MIEFKFQFSIIVFSFIYGLLIYYLLYLCRDYINYPNHFFKIINTLTFFLTFSLIYLFGLELVCDGVLHIYSLLIVVLTGYVTHLIAKIKK